MDFSRLLSPVSQVTPGPVQLWRGGGSQAGVCRAVLFSRFRNRVLKCKLVFGSAARNVESEIMKPTWNAQIIHNAPS